MNPLTLVLKSKGKMDNITPKDTDLVVLKSRDLTNTILNVKQDLRKYWDKDYINEHIESCKNHSHKILMRFLWITGVRITEALSIKKSDLNFKDRLITVRWLKSRKYNERVLPMHQDIRFVLELYVANMKASDKVFPICRQRAFQITTQHLGGSPHRLRHSFAYNFVKQSRDIVMLKMLMGHKNINTTMEYLKICPADQAEAISKIQFR